ncbi:ComF family protein [Taibaiella lutea]|uniref:ComF family protein n=1 Tax=Taibaiella lutea TaxID=2608001 RepID=A0A5M6CRK5_9BACT|nr:ComF family protein [Taibaiella lutea]KAA5537000.1 ComF family protein [Taibaiella lutea]
MIISILKNTAESLLHLFYPQLCASCNRPLHRDENSLCLHCILKLPRTGFHNHQENKAANIFIGRAPIEHATSFVYFTKDGIVQDLLHTFKYEGKKDIGRLLGMLFASELKSTDWINKIDYIIAIPLHKRKERQRGFNQAEIFAESIAKELNISLLKNSVIRTKFTHSQTTKNRLERIENVSGIFSVLKKQDLKNKHILLIDDVLTTGATLESCALELLKTKSVKVSIATIALAMD